jgi:hypothetical protein
MTQSKLKSAKKLLLTGIPAKEVAHNLGISIPTLYDGYPLHRLMNVNILNVAVAGNDYLLDVK